MKLDTRVSIYVRNWCLLSVGNLTKWTIKKKKEITVQENIKKISALFLELTSENWDSDIKWFSYKQMCINEK